MLRGCAVQAGCVAVLVLPTSWAPLRVLGVLWTVNTPSMARGVVR